MVPKSQRSVSPDIVVAKSAAVVMYEGEAVTLVPGITRVRVGHPILKGREELFEPLDIHFDVEHAEARPGHKRRG